MRNKFKLMTGALLGSLLLVGAGCAGTPTAQAPTAVPPQTPPAAEAPAVQPPVAAQDKPLPSNVDAAVDDIAASAESEANADDTASDSSALTEDKPEVQAITDSAYDPK